MSLPEQYIGFIENITHTSQHQRLIDHETRMLLTGTCDNLRSQQLRYHHIFTRGTLAMEWMLVTEIKPWNYQNEEQFNQDVISFAIDYSENKLNTSHWEFHRKRSQIPRLRAFSGIEGVEDNSAGERTNSHSGWYDFLKKVEHDIEYYEDRWGRDKRERNATKLSVFLDVVNFLLVARRDPDAHIGLTKDPDDICRSCRGGLEEYGKHCTRYVEPDRSDDHILKIALEAARDRNHAGHHPISAEWVTPRDLFSYDYYRKLNNAIKNHLSD